MELKDEFCLVTRHSHRAVGQAPDIPYPVYPKTAHQIINHHHPTLHDSLDTIPEIPLSVASLMIYHLLCDAIREIFGMTVRDDDDNSATSFRPREIQLMR